MTRLTEDEFRDFLAVVRESSDVEIWLLAALVVSFAGRRAEERRRNNIEIACLKFVQSMHVLTAATTPAAPSERLKAHGLL